MISVIKSLCTESTKGACQKRLHGRRLVQGICCLAGPQHALRLQVARAHRVGRSPLRDLGTREARSITHGPFLMTPPQRAP